MNSKSLTSEESRIVNLAIGRILRMAARPALEGDVAEYKRCRGLIVDLLGDPKPDSIMAKPLPGWNFGTGATGVVE